MDELNAYRIQRRLARERDGAADFLLRVYDSYTGRNGRGFTEHPRAVLVGVVDSRGAYAEARGASAEDWRALYVVVQQRFWASLRAEREPERKAAQEAYERENPHACTSPGCPRRFATERGLAIHMRSHRG